MATKSATERIAEIKANAQAEIDKLKVEALALLNAEKKNHLDRVKELDKEIEELSGKAPSSKASGTRKKISIEDVVASIKAGNTNYPAIARHLGASTANVAGKIKAEGKKAGITKTGERASMKLGVK
jgi:hypothetical protein